MRFKNTYNISHKNRHRLLKMKERYDFHCEFIGLSKLLYHNVFFEHYYKNEYLFYKEQPTRLGMAIYNIEKLPQEFFQIKNMYFLLKKELLFIDYKETIWYNYYNEKLL